MKSRKKLSKKSHISRFRGHPVMEQVKAARKQSREEELKAHGKAINYQKVIANKKKYNRKKNKADDEILPYFLFSSPQGEAIKR